MGDDITGAHFFQLIFKRKLWKMTFNKQWFISQPACFQSSVEWSPVASFEMSDLDTHHYVRIFFSSERCHIRIHIIHILFKRTSSHAIASDIEESENACF